VLDPGRSLFCADQDRRLVAVELDGHVVRRPISRLQHFAGARIDQPILRGHPALSIEEHPRSTVLGITEIEDARIQQTTTVRRNVPAGTRLHDR